MGKTIRLTESDLTRIVRRVINENKRENIFSFSHQHTLQESDHKHTHTHTHAHMHVHAQS